MWNRIRNYLACAALACLAAFPLAAAEHHGVVKFGGLPLPGATVTLSQGDKKLTAVTDGAGIYSFADVPGGTWSLQVEMLCFAPIKQEVAIAPGAPSPEWEMKLLSFDEIKANAPPPTQPSTPPTVAPSTATATPVAGAPPKPSIAGAEQAANGGGNNNKGKNSKNSKNTKTANATPANPTNGFQRADVNAAGGTPPPPPADSGIGAAASGDAPSSTASDAMVVNGSVSNGIERRVIGNARRGPGALYRGDVNAVFSNSALNAHAYSLTGQNTPQPAYNNLRFGGSFGGPLYIPHVLKSNGQIFLNYQGSRSRNANNQTVSLPTLAERIGDFSQATNLLGQPLAIFDPTTGAPFPGNVIPLNRISPAARDMLGFYPNPNFFSPLGYNYQAPITTISNSDAAQIRFNRNLNRKNFINGNYGFQRTDGTGANIFGFLDPNESFGQQVNLSYRHMFNQRINGNLNYTYSRQSTSTTPYFANVKNVSAELGISGNDQSPNNWGPPSLGFNGGSGIQGLNDANENLSRNQTQAVGYNMLWIRRPHNLQFGGDFRRIDANPLTQQNGRGGFNFTGAATQQIVNGVPVQNTGFDFADFLLDRPDIVNLAVGNADKYFRSSSYDAFITDDWRIGPSLSVNYGMRWEYGSPVVEKYGRLVNLDVNGFYAAVAPVTGQNPTGPLTGKSYADSLVKPDKHGFEPRVALAWHPIFGSSLVVRAGYGVYYDTSVYQSIVNQMSQQSPFSRTLNLAGSLTNPLSMATAFNSPASGTPNTFAVDPDFRVGYSQNWQISAQRDLPGGNVLTVTYLGIKGTRAVQVFVPNTYPAGAANPCPSCPTNFYYMTSNGNSTREAGQVQLQRRFHNGISASVNYTFSKALDNAALGGRGGGGSVVAQNWLNLSAERGYSPFDQRHLVTFNMQYTSGVGVKGGTLLSGWRGVALKRWTILTNLTAGTGKPATPSWNSAILTGTAISGPVRPEYTGVDAYDAPAGRFLNPGAYIAPLPGQWGNAGRNSIIGPTQFAMNASMQRTFEDVIDVRLDATNALNHVTYPSWNTNASSQQFGLPNQPLAMRQVTLTLRWRF
jgi:trimeric autotransporter adhesin